MNMDAQNYLMLMNEIDRLRAQNAKLIAALELVNESIGQDDYGDFYIGMSGTTKPRDVIERLSEAIGGAKGETK